MPACNTCWDTTKLMVVAGIGLLSDLYDLSVINVVKPILKDLYPINGSWSSSWEDSLITSSSIFGAMVGMLVLGALADRLGRRTLLLVSASLTFLGSLGATCSCNFGQDGIWMLLIGFRFIMGIGIGGEYPLAASHTAEHSDANSSGWRMAMVYSMMGVGSLLATVLVYLLEVGNATPEATWRIAFGFGAFLSICNVAIRYRFVSNSEKFEQVQQERAAAKGELGGASHTSEMAAVVRTYWRPLAGTMLTWLLYDICSYGLSLYSDDILSALDLGGREDASGSVDYSGTTLGVLIVALISFPAFLMAAPLVTYVGRKQTGMLGTTGMLIVFVALVFLTSGGEDSIRDNPGLFLVLYSAQNMFNFMGPGATTYIIPGEIFPTHVRATCHGLSAASGKAGAAFGAYMFGPLKDDLGIQGLFIFVACLTGSLLAFMAIFLPSYGQYTLDHIEEAERDGQAITLLYHPSRYIAPSDKSSSMASRSAAPPFESSSC